MNARTVARCDPARSDYCASRHLLRHLGNARELRRNPLARDVFARGGDDALQVLADRVWRAFRTLEAQPSLEGARRKARHAAILLRVDLEGHPPAEVAGALGLSMRQFYRERAAAHARFVRAFRAVSPARVEPNAGRAQHLLERAAALADSGESASARAIFEDLAARGDAAQRCAALVRLAEADAAAHRFAAGRARLREAGLLLSTTPGDAACDAALRDRADAVGLSLQWFERGPHALAAVDRFNGDPKRGRTLLVLAAAAVRAGESVRASRLLRHEAVAEAARQSADAAIDALTLQAELADFVDEDSSLGERLLIRAIALARQSGFRGRERYAEHQLRSARWMRGRTTDAARAYRRLCDGDASALSPRLRGALALCTADIETAVGHPLRALRSARDAARVATSPYEVLSARALSAGALLRARRIVAAGEEAAAVAEAARAAGHPRIVSLAQRINAQTQFVRGNRRAAREAIEESLACARRFSSAHVYGQARAVLDRIVAGSAAG